MTIIVFGVRKMAVPVPATIMRSTMPGTDVVGPSVARESSPPATMISPVTATPRGPTPSARRPASGETTIIARGKPTMSAPASSVLKPRASTR